MALGDRRPPALWQLVRVPCGGLGPQCAGVRRPGGGRWLPEAFLSARRADQCAGGAVRRRRGRLPKLHLCQVRPGDPGPARRSLPGRCSTPGSRRCFGDEQYRIKQATAGPRPILLEELAAKLEDVRRGQRRPGDADRVQRGGEDRHPVRSQHQGRPRHDRSHGPEVQLGQSDRYAAVRGLRRHLRRHLHLRRAEDRSGRPGDRPGGRGHPRPLCGGRAGRWPLLQQLPRRLGADGRLRVRQDRRQQRRRSRQRGPCQRRFASA